MTFTPSPDAPDAASTLSPEGRETRRSRLSRTLLITGAALVVAGLSAALIAGPTTDSHPPASPASTDPGAAARNASSGTASARAARPSVPVLRPPPSLDPYVPLDGSRPARVLVIGDSVAATLQASIVTATHMVSDRGVPAEVTRFWTVPGFGLTADHPGLLDWDGANLDQVHVPPPSAYASWQEDLLRWTADDRPDVVLVLAGAWDAIPRYVGDRWLVPGTPEWRRWYMNLIDQANVEFGATGALVAWLRYPCIESQRQSERLDLVNGIVEQAASLRPGRVTVLPFDDAVCPDGHFVPTYRLPGDQTDSMLRMTDGVHFQIFGAVRYVAPWLADQLQTLVGPAR